MLGKLIKHEFRATGRIMLPVLAVLVLLSGLAGGSINLLNSGLESDLLNTIGVLLTMAYSLGLFAAAVLSVVLMIQRFYSNLMGDEGYLMLTLPAGVDAHIFSKLIVSFVWFAVTCIICLLSMFVIMLTNVSFADLGEFFAEMSRVFAEITQYVSLGHFVGYLFEFVLLFFVGSCVTCLHFYAAIAAGHSFSNHKVLLSVVFYFVISFAINVFMMFLVWAADKVGIIERATAFMDAVKPQQFASLAHVGMLYAIVFGVIIAALCYLPTTLLMKKRLNLS